MCAIRLADLSSYGFHKSDEGGNGDQVKSGIALSSFNFINSIIGAGALGMPYAMKQAGLFLGILLLTMMAVITDFTVILLVESGSMAGQSSYVGLMKSTFGNIGYGLVLSCQFIFPFLAMNGYAVIVGDSLVKFFQLVGAESTILTNRQFVIGISILLIMTPLCLLKKISKLGMASFFSLICVGAVIVTVFIRLATLGPDIPHTEGAFNFAHENVPQAIGVMAFGKGFAY
ncbi:uncharacterized protein TRIADDRAFT_54864 [Trichoplax adhaerens]|uniref:Putative sodium-coupled neutral amino acid transporter 11 n=1 Tax=Trichoplax adhaerens TaxID=10228 RepID=B3RT75_TRIAD|nr:hypothetical protein TRIADDRAFT_54864 [Trichoplax adhaerens]EDV26647.1 hypothetical protein TRIADDRAFT_54864 [Trichoplax adhaerens]|eukprot:XP_002110643.1 hypothetical protein TRIADDRAFT_54864 [Trichoplax adhaerens]